MKQNTLTLPIVGGGIAFLFFFFPWIKLDLSSMGMNDMLPNVKIATSISGIRYATGGTSFITLAFLATIAVIGICIYTLSQQTPWKARTIVLISSGIGFFAILFTLISVMQGISDGMRIVRELWQSAGQDADPSKMITLQIGGFGSTIGLIIAFIGGWNIPKSDNFVEVTETE